MKTTKTAPRVALAALILGAAAGPSCAKGKPPGEVMMVLQTDLSLPKDVDSVLIEVLVRGDQRFKQSFERLGADESLKIPASLGITISDGDDPATPVTLRVTAFEQGVARILREAVTTIPADRIATLPLPIQWLCWNQVQVDANGDAQTTCGPGDTCIAGSCVTKTIDVSKLVDYTAASVFGGGTGKGDGSCFDASSCFVGSTDAPIDMASCSIAVSSDVNVGIRATSAGICGPAGCFVVLDGKSDSGWQPGAAGTIKLPSAVCARVTSGLASGVSIAPVSSTCPLKTSGLPACGSWTSSGTAPPAPGSDTPVALVTNQSHPAALAVAGGFAYWTDSGTSDMSIGAVKRLSVAGGNTTLLSGAQAFPKDLALGLDAQGNVAAVYWATNGVGAAGAILGLDLSMPSSPMPIDFTIAGLVSPEGLTVQGSDLFFTDFGGNAIYSVDLGTRMGMVLAGPQNELAQNGAYRVVADTNTIYWTNEATPGSVMMALRMDPQPTAIAASQGTPRDLALDLQSGVASAIFWTNYTSGEVMTAPLTAGPPATAGAPVTFATQQDKPYGIVIDGGTIYWTNEGAGTIAKAPKAGGAPVVIASGQQRPGAITVDQSNVYWINQGSLTKADGAIMKLAKTAP